MKASEKVKMGWLLLRDASGRTIAGVTALNCTSGGVAYMDADATGQADGVVTVQTVEGVCDFAFGTAGDSLAEIDAPCVVYCQDNQTVTKTDGANSRSPAGIFLGINVDNGKARVFVGRAAAAIVPGILGGTFDLATLASQADGSHGSSLIGDFVSGGTVRQKLDEIGNTVQPTAKTQADSTHYGVSKLSLAPAVASTPIAVGTNDTRLAPAPSAAGKLAYDTGAAYALTAAGSTSQVLHGAAGSPTWAAVNLATEVTGLLPAANVGPLVYTVGAALTDTATTTVARASNRTSFLLAGTMSQGETITLNPAAGAIAGDMIKIIRTSTDAHTATIVDGGVGTPTLMVIPLRGLVTDQTPTLAEGGAVAYGEPDRGWSNINEFSGRGTL